MFNPFVFTPFSWPFCRWTEGDMGRGLSCGHGSAGDWPRRRVHLRGDGSKTPYGYGSKLSHQDMDRRFWSMFPLTRYRFLTHSHILVLSSPQTLPFRLLPFPSPFALLLFLLVPLPTNMGLCTYFCRKTAFLFVSWALCTNPCYLVGGSLL